MSRHLRFVAAALIGSACSMLLTPAVRADENPAQKLASFPSADAQAICESIQDGIDFLLGYQNANGSWGSPTRTKELNIYAPVPGSHQAFRAAVTSLCLSALVEISRYEKFNSPQIDRAIKRGEAWLIENLPKVRRATPDALYNVWTHGYSLQAMVRLCEYHPDDAKTNQKLDEIIAQQVDLLGRYESVDGGWGYYDFEVGSQKPGGSSISFTTATILLGLYEARQHGIAVPQKLVDRALAALYRQQKSDFTYLYGEYLKWRPMMGVNRVGGSLGRSQACNLVLRLYGDEKITDDVLKDWLVKLVTRNGWLDMGRKRPIPHESWLKVAGYFYYYGHYYASLCLQQLPPDERPEYAGRLADILLQRQEKDGSWFDFPFYDYHQPYGTAFAIMTLHRCLPAGAAGQ